jgi:hypothetical protein
MPDAAPEHTSSPPAPAPNTVTEAVEFLRGAGYVDDVELDSGNLSCARTQMTYALDNVIVDHTFRFEGDSDPGDEAIVLGLRYPGTDVRATLVSAFGPYADPATTEFLSRLPKS